MKDKFFFVKEVLFRVVPREKYQLYIEHLLDSVGAEVLAVDRTGIVTVWNRRLEERVCPKAEALGKPIGDLIEMITDPLRAVDIEDLILHDVMGTGASVYLDRYPQQDREGNPILYDIRIDPLRASGDGAVLGAVLMRTDVTEKYFSSDQEVRTARTSSLANLGASIAHEIRNPLNSISVNLQLLREDVESLRAAEQSGILESVDMIAEETGRLNRIVENFLRFSRMPEPTLATGNLNEVVGKALKLLEAQMRDKGVVVDFRPAFVAPVALDADLLPQAIQNILLNALQATPPGGALTVETRTTRHSVVVGVSDSGPGIPPADRERIFDLFYSRREGGTGLGLPIANRIVEEHGGRIAIGKSEAGGAAFEIHLPLTEG